MIDNTILSTTMILSYYDNVVVPLIVLPAVVQLLLQTVCRACAFHASVHGRACTQKHPADSNPTLLEEITNFSLDLMRKNELFASSVQGPGAKWALKKAPCEYILPNRLSRGFHEKSRSTGNGVWQSCNDVTGCWSSLHGITHSGERPMCCYLYVRTRDFFWLYNWVRFQ